MKKYARILVAVAFLLGLGVTANAEIQPEIVVTLPFEFVAGGKTLPAGTYTVKRFSQQPFNALMLTSYDNGISVFVRPSEMEGASTDKPKHGKQQHSPCPDQVDQCAAEQKRQGKAGKRNAQRLPYHVCGVGQIQSVEELLLKARRYIGAHRKS